MDFFESNESNDHWGILVTLDVEKPQLVAHWPTFPEHHFTWASS